MDDITSTVCWGSIAVVCGILAGNWTIIILGVCGIVLVSLIAALGG